MPLQLTKAHRRIAIGAAALIAILLIYQADKVGLDETPWLIGILAIAALLAASFSGGHDKEVVIQTVVKGLEPSKVYKKAFDVFEAEFIPWAVSSPIKFKHADMTRAFEGHVRLQAVKLAWITTGLLLAKESQAFRQGAGFKSFQLLGGVEARKCLRELPGISGPDASKLSLTESAKEIANCTVRLDMAIDRFARNQNFPMSPAFRAIEEQWPFAEMTKPTIQDPDERLEAAYGALFRKAALAARS